MSQRRLSLMTLFESIIKVWDLRKAHSRRVNPAFVENNEEAVAENMKSSRPHGISSMVLSPNGQKLFALSTDRKCVQRPYLSTLS